jgi:hypothetical protein
MIFWLVNTLHFRSTQLTISSIRLGFNRWQNSRPSGPDEFAGAATDEETNKTSMISFLTGLLIGNHGEGTLVKDCAIVEVPAGPRVSVSCTRCSKTIAQTAACSADRTCLELDSGGERLDFVEQSTSNTLYGTHSPCLVLRISSFSVRLSQEILKRSLASYASRRPILTMVEIRVDAQCRVGGGLASKIIGRHIPQFKPILSYNSTA